MRACWIIFLLWLPLTLFGMVEESGTLRGFIFDSCAECAYDNWLSHVSERIVRDNYNDYGPPNLDPVTNGFGGFTYINESAAGDTTLARWRRVFDYAMVNQWQSVDSMLVLYEVDWNYELVHFRSAERRSEFYILRERLDLSFVDLNGDTASANDVIGGFRKGWGVFVFNPAARHANAIVQVPHPEDDYMAPPVATEIFIRGEFAILMIAGAGREVMWDTTEAQFINSLSFSDPSRNRRHPFAIATEAAKDAWDTPPVSSFIVVQLHSYDHDEHFPLGDMQVTAFFDDHFPNMPFRDIGAHLDFIHALPRFPICGFAGDTSINTRVDEYVSLWCDPEYAHFGVDTIAIRSITDFIGAPENQQGLYCHTEHDAFLHTENFVHIELDEYPDALWQPTDFGRWLPGSPPARLSNFQNVLAYYSPFVAALDSALTWHEVPDTSAPRNSRITLVAEANNTSVDVHWGKRAYDQHFDTYQIFFDTVAITEFSRSKTRTSGASYVQLGDQSTTVQRIFNLVPPLDRYRFAIRAKDVLNQFSELSPEWGIIDSVIHDLTIHVNGDSLLLNWSGQYYDDHYEIWEYPAGLGGYNIIGTTDSSEFTFAPSEMQSNRVSLLYVKKILVK